MKQKKKGDGVARDDVDDGVGWAVERRTADFNRFCCCRSLDTLFLLCFLLRLI